MAIRWNATLLRDICILPTAVADNELRFASAPQLKVLLWFAAHEKENVGVDACAAALHMPLETVQAAAEYWVSRGVFVADDIASPPPAETAQPTPAPAPAPAQRPAAVKPQMKEVIRRQKESGEFSALLEDVSARLGKPLSHGDMETLLYLFDTAGIDATVIVMAVGYAVSRSKYSMRYIETVLLGWQDSGITGMQAVDEHLRFLEQADAAADKVCAILGRARELTGAQKKIVHTWIYVWEFSDDMITLALDQAKKKARDVIPYADKILQSWHADGVTDVAAATQSKGNGKGQTVTSSLDVQEYESMLEDYVPTIPRKE